MRTRAATNTHTHTQKRAIQCAKVPRVRVKYSLRQRARLYDVIGHTVIPRSGIVATRVPCVLGEQPKTQKKRERGANQT